MMQDPEEVRELYEHYHFTVDKGQSPLRLDKFLNARIEGTSRARIQKAADAGYISVNGRPEKNNYLVKPLDEISISFPYERRDFQLIPQDLPLNIPYEDAHLLLVDKAPGMTVHPGHGNYEGTLVNALAWHFGLRKPMSDCDARMGGLLVHRIDKDTSGLLVVAKTEEAQFALAKQFFDHSIRREYVALVWGNIEENEGTVDAAIGRHPADRLRFSVCKDPSQGKHAVTHYRVLERFGYVTLVACRLETGRTHQIRVHMAYLGHPLFNDLKYGGATIREGAKYTKFKQFIDNCFALMPRQALHARELGFVHPATREEVCFESPLPPDFEAVLDKWRRYTAAMPAMDEA